MMRCAWLIAVASFLPGALGCGPGGPKTYTITGTVTFDGLPVEKGEIIFVAVDEDQAPDSGFIHQGSYSVPVKAGHKRVEIRASREVPEKRNPMGPVFQSYVPECYNAKSRLSADIRADGKKQWDFFLKSKAE